jgi:hypothetical protein
MEHGDINGRIAVVESAEKMTDGQVAARVKAHFANKQSTHLVHA